MIEGLDEDGDGEVDLVEFLSLMEPVVQSAERVETPEKVAQRMFSMLDEDGGGTVTTTEFKHMFRVRAYRPALTRADEGRYYFTIVLSDDSGYPATTLVGVYVEVIFEDVPPNLNSNCTARISSLDRWGYATVEFNHDMQAIYN